MTKKGIDEICMKKSEQQSLEREKEKENAMQDAEMYY